MTEFVCRKYPEDGYEYDDDGRYMMVSYSYDRETVVEAAMAFYHEEGEFPDEVVEKKYNKVVDKYLARPKKVADLEKMLDDSEKRLGQYIRSRQQSIRAAQDLFHQAKVSLLAVNTSQGDIKR